MTRKEKAFKLFEEGKGARDPKVKALGLKAKTRANYYYEWKQGAEDSQTTKGSQSLPSGEAIGGIDETKKVSKEATASKPENQ